MSNLQQRALYHSQVWTRYRAAVKPLADAMRALGRAMAKTAKAMAAACPMLREMHRTDWWKRGESPPEYVAIYEPPKWWQRGDDPPPDFGLAV